VIAVTHDRYFLDNVAQWILELDRGHGIPWKGNYSSWLEQKQRRQAIEQRTRTGRQKAMARELEWIRQGAKARQAKIARRASTPTRRCSRKTTVEKEREFEILIPPGPRLGDLVVEADKIAQGLRRQAAVRERIVRAAAGRHRRRDRTQRRRQDHALPHDHRAASNRTTARYGSVATVKIALRRPVTRLVARTRQDRLGGDQRRRGHHADARPRR
jgi:ATPase subunit of ABC transporter with duplicated ATPase domains